jgi:splicing factor 3B subunit 2
LSLNQEECDMMDSETIAIGTEAVLREQQSQLAKEDLSDMVAENAAKQSRLVNLDKRMNIF